MKTSAEPAFFKHEKKLFWIVLLALIAFYTTFQYFHRQLGHSDNAFLSEITDSIAHRGIAYSQVAAANEQAFSTAFVIQPEKLCSMDLVAPPVREFNYFRWHTYFILYLFAPLVWVFGAPLVLSFFTSLAFVGMLGLAYYFCRKKKVPVPLALLGTVLIFIHPAWNGGMVGQIYVDRFFIGLGFLLAMTLESSSTEGSKFARLSLIGVAALCTLLSDRFGLAVGGILIAFAVLSKPYFAITRSRVLLVTFGLIFAVFSILVIKLYIQHPNYSGFLSLANLPTIFKTNFWPERMTYFFIVNFALLGVFSVFAPKYFLIALALMIPNIFTNIGGAEKTSFLTHYHSVYFPMLAFASLAGLSTLCARLSKAWMRGALYVVITAMIIVQAGIRYDAPAAATVSDLREMPIAQRDFALPFNRISDYLKPGQESVELRMLRAAREAIPSGSKVSTPEWGMAWLEPEADVYFYPYGLDVADYLLVQFVPGESGKPFFKGMVNYLGPDVEHAENVCLNERIEKQFDIANMKTFGDRAVLKRKAAL